MSGEKELLATLDRLKGKLGDAAIVLGAAVDGRVHLVASVAPALVERGVKAGEIVKVAAAEVAGGGGGGRDTMARAGGRDPEKLAEALASRARGDRGRAGLSRDVRVLALDYGSARCGCALSDPTGTLATPIEPVERPGDARRAAAPAPRWSREREVERVVVGLPLSLSGGDSEQTREARAFAERLARARSRRCPVELYDERLHDARQAQRTGGAASEDSRAAAHLLEGWLARRGGD